MFALLLALTLSSQMAPPVPKGAKVLSTKGKKKQIPPCVHKGNPDRVLKLARYEARIVLRKETFNITRKATFYMNTAWKKDCNHFFKVGFPLTTSVDRGKEEQVTVSFPPRSGSPQKLHLFSKKLWKEGSTTKVKGFLGAALKIPPMAGNPTDRSFTLELTQRDIPLPAPAEDKLRVIELALSQLKNFALHPGFTMNITLSVADPWIFQGGTLPDEKRLEERVSWTAKALPESDVALTFSDFEIVDKPPKKGDPGDPPSAVLLITIAVMAVLSGGVLFFLYRRAKKKRPQKKSNREG